MENNETKKINFFKKLWYSIAKINKYEEMKKEGLFASIKYIAGVIAILCLIIGILACIIQKMPMNEQINETINNTQSRSYIFYFIIYFLAYFIIICIEYILYILLIAFAIWINSKLYKVNWTLQESLITTIYSSTLSVIVFVALSVIFTFAGIHLPLDIINILLIYFYCFIVLYKERNKIRNINKTK